MSGGLTYDDDYFEEYDEPALPTEKLVVGVDSAWTQMDESLLLEPNMVTLNNEIYMKGFVS